jgi:hypothetical protein
MKLPNERCQEIGYGISEEIRHEKDYFQMAMELLKKKTDVLIRIRSKYKRNKCITKYNGEVWSHYQQMKYR